MENKEQDNNGVHLIVKTLVIVLLLAFMYIPLTNVFHFLEAKKTRIIREANLLGEEVAWNDNENNQDLGKEVIALCDEGIQRYGDQSEWEHHLRMDHDKEEIVKLFITKAIVLWKLKRLEEANAAFDLVLEQFSKRKEPLIRAQIAEALYKKATLLEAMERKEEALALYDEILNRYGEDVSFEFYVEEAKRKKREHQVSSKKRIIER